MAEQKECHIEEGYLIPDHVHMLIAIPPRYWVVQVIGFLKGKAAIHIAWTYTGRRENNTGQHFWARGYDVTTGRRDRAAMGWGLKEACIKGASRRTATGDKAPPYPDWTEMGVVAGCWAGMGMVE